MMIEYLQHNIKEKIGYHNYYISVLDKVCPTPDPFDMGNGTLSHITYPFQSDVLTYRTTATYQCDLGYELEDLTTTNDVHCMQNGSWTPNRNCKGKCI